MLPKVKVPTYPVIIPSSKREAHFRPFVVREEKILLMAKAGEDSGEIVHALKQIVGNCVTYDAGDVFDPDDLTMFDLEYLFLRIRGKSVDNKVKLSYRDSEDDKVRDFEIDLDDIQIQYPEEVSSSIQISDEVGMKLRYPRVRDITDLAADVSDELAGSELIVSCISTIWNGDELHVAKDTPRQELVEFVDSLPLEVMEKVRTYLDAIPHMHHVIKYTNDKGTEREIVLSTLEDFFILD